MSPGKQLELQNRERSVSLDNLSITSHDNDIYNSSYASDVTKDLNEEEQQNSSIRIQESSSPTFEKAFKEAFKNRKNYVDVVDMAATSTTNVMYSNSNPWIGAFLTFGLFFYSYWKEYFDLNARSAELFEMQEKSQLARSSFLERIWIFGLGVGLGAIFLGFFVVLTLIPDDLSLTPLIDVCSTISLVLATIIPISAMKLNVSSLKYKTEKLRIQGNFPTKEEGERFLREELEQSKKVEKNLKNELMKLTFGSTQREQNIKEELNQTKQLVQDLTKELALSWRSEQGLDKKFTQSILDIQRLEEAKDELQRSVDIKEKELLHKNFQMEQLENENVQLKELNQLFKRSFKDEIVVKSTLGFKHKKVQSEGDITFFKSNSNNTAQINFKNKYNEDGNIFKK